MRLLKMITLCFGLLTVPISPLSAQAGEDEAEFIDRTPEDCVPVTRIRKTEIVDDESILFFMRNGEVYRNVLPRRCPRLKREGRFMYRVSGARLCDIDQITVLERGFGVGGSGLARGASCGLGEFHPISEIEAEFLLADPDDVVSSPESFEVKPVELPPEEEEQPAGTR